MTGEFEYTIRRGLAGAGRTVWRWTVQHLNAAADLATGTSIKSEGNAKADALAAIARLTAAEEITNLLEGYDAIMNEEGPP
jgi:hypothetical protein